MRARDDAYLAWVRERPCLVCGRAPCDPHHQAERGHGAMGLKPSDYRAVPLCGGVEGHHTGRGTREKPGSYHALSRAFWERYGIDVEREIVRLNTTFFGLSD